METVLFDEKLKIVGPRPEKAAVSKKMKTFLRREALLRTMAFFYRRPGARRL